MNFKKHTIKNLSTKNLNLSSRMTEEKKLKNIRENKGEEGTRATTWCTKHLIFNIFFILMFEIELLQN
jgi:hypothetical protein